MLTAEPLELDQRVADGGFVTVRLLWDPDTNTTFVRVDDRRADDHFDISVGDRAAREIFTHPFAYRED